MLSKVAKGEFRNLLAAVKLAVKQNKEFIIFPKRQYRYLELMNILVNEGFILGFEERGSLIIIHLKQQYRDNYALPIQPLNNIRPLTRLHRKDTYSARDLCKLQRLNGHTNLFVVSTDQGIITNAETTRYVGGIPLFWVD